MRLYVLDIALINLLSCIGNWIQSIHGRIDDEFFDNLDPKDEDYETFWRGLGYGVHPELEALCTRYSLAKVDNHHPLLFWYKWTMYYRVWIRIKGTRLFARCFFSKEE
ncbi:MAG: hypothetical protein PF508_15055 [Spirochaeta sp.]|nr:hypothetical protein [Spirochaeta sp.]